MNEVGREQNENKEKSLIFTKETCGVVLALFSALCLVCLITRETVFSEIGRIVNAFLFGCFGFFAYAVIVSLFGLGVLLISGKKMNISIKRKLLITAVSFTLVLILQLATTNSNSLELGEYLTVCYAMGEQGISSASAGGLFAGVISYFLCKLLTGVGSYVILGLALALLFFALVKDLMKQDKKDKKSDGKKFRSSFVEENGQIDNNTSNESDSQDKGVQGAGQTAQPIQSNPNFYQQPR